MQTGSTSRFIPPGLGWCQSLRDFRDFTPETPQIKELLARLPSTANGSSRPETVDLREFFPAVHNQQGLNSSAAHAIAGIVEYFVRRATGKVLDPSRLFLYYTTRKLLRANGSCSTDLRTGLKAMKCFGIPPEEFWPYDVEKVNCEPESFLYSFSAEYRGIHYLRLDMRNTLGTRTLELVRLFLAAGFPVAFGFPVPASISTESDIPYRPAFDSIRGGQAVVCVGYDDRRLGATRGALLVRNSWGPEWGEAGYGWLPYRYVEEQLASEFWTLLHAEWLDSGEFQRPVI